MKTGPLYAALLLLVSGCASKTIDSSSPAGPLASGAGYHFYYADSGGIKHLDAAREQEHLLLPATGDATAWRASPDDSWLGVAYRDRDSVRLALVELAASRVARVLAGSPDETLTLAWSPGADQLAVGYFTEQEVSGRRVPDRGDIVTVSLDGSVKRVGCRVAKRVEAWLAGGQLVVGDGWNLYVVQASNCRTLWTIRMGRKHAMRFSPDGQKVAYFESDGGGRGGSNAEGGALYVADFTGRNPTLVVGAEYAPRHARWSPDARQIAFDVRSLQHTDVRHVAVYDLDKVGTSFFATQTERGIPHDSDPHWSPSGAELLHDRAYPPSTSVEKVVRAMRIADDGVQIAPRVVMVGTPAARTRGWVDDASVLVALPDSAMLLNTEAGTAAPLPAGRILHVRSVR